MDGCARSVVLISTNVRVQIWADIWAFAFAQIHLERKKSIKNNGKISSEVSKILLDKINTLAMSSLMTF